MTDRPTGFASVGMVIALAKKMALRYGVVNITDIQLDSASNGIKFILADGSTVTVPFDASELPFNDATGFLNANNVQDAILQLKINSILMRTSSQMVTDLTENKLPLGQIVICKQAGDYQLGGIYQLGLEDTNKIWVELSAGINIDEETIDENEDGELQAIALKYEDEVLDVGDIILRALNNTNIIIALTGTSGTLTNEQFEAIQQKPSNIIISLANRLYRYSQTAEDFKAYTNKTYPTFDTEETKQITIYTDEDDTENYKTWEVEDIISNGSVEIDGESITKNSDNELQAVTLKNKNVRVTSSDIVEGNFNGITHFDSDDDFVLFVQQGYIERNGKRINYDSTASYSTPSVSSGALISLTGTEGTLGDEQFNKLVSKPFGSVLILGNRVYRYNQRTENSMVFSNIVYPTVTTQEIKTIYVNVVPDALNYKHWNLETVTPVIDKALKIDYLTSAPTEDNTDGLKFVVLSTEPQTRYSGYIYFIVEV